MTRLLGFTVLLLVASAGHAQPQPTAADVRAALARYRHEPSAAATVRAARAALARSATATMAGRARAAGWVPTVGFSARRGQAIDVSSEVAADDSLRLSTDEDLTLSATLTFELDRVVFRREETTIAREARADRHARAARIREVVHLYFERRRLQVERDLGVGDPADKMLRIAEVEALLDVFTGFEAGASGWRIVASTSVTTLKSPPSSTSAATS